VLDLTEVLQQILHETVALRGLTDLGAT